MKNIYHKPAKDKPATLPLTAAAARAALKKLSSAKRAKGARAYFKTAPGEYGYGDIFIGLTVPQTRQVARRFSELPLKEIAKLLDSKIHEERQLALEICVHRFAKGTPRQQKEIYSAYLKQIDRVNNWDLVDLSAPGVVGAWLVEHPGSLLHKLAKSKLLWRRRIAVVATHAFIRKHEVEQTLQIVELLMQDEHDLIHKACGWMLREVGNRNRAVLNGFLKLHAAKMPRTMLRYSIERHSAEERAHWLSHGKPPQAKHRAARLGK